MRANYVTRLALTPEERLAAYRLRYEIYIEELGWSSPHADHENGILTDQFDRDASLFVAYDGAVAAGAMRLIYSDHPCFAFYAKLYGLEDELNNRRRRAAVASSLIVRPQHRGGRVVYDLTCAAYQRAVADRIAIGFLDCNPEMVDLYRRMGFTAYREGVFHPYYQSMSVCMRMKLGGHSIWTRRESSGRRSDQASNGAMRPEEKSVSQSGHSPVEIRPGEVLVA